MTRDPLEELFGPLEPEGDDSAAADAPTAAQPTTVQPTAAQPAAAQPAPPRRAAAPEAATRAFAQQPAPQPVQQSAPQPVRRRQGGAREELPTMPVPATSDRRAAMLPWIIIGAVVAIALIVALIVVNAARGGDAKPETTTDAPKPTATTDTNTGKNGDEDPEDTPEEKPATTPDAPPRVDVGPNPIHMEVSYAGISIDASQKLGPTLMWNYSGDPVPRVMLHTTLAGTFPESCAAMRSIDGKSPWGIEQGTAGKWTVVKPEGTCAADPELYKQVWGLMQAVADSAKPL